jgi:hypothetical protein
VVDEEASVRAKLDASVDSVTATLQQSVIREATRKLNELSDSSVRPEHLKQIIDEHFSQLGATPGSDSASSSAVEDGRVVGEMDDDVTDHQRDSVIAELRRTNFDIVEAIFADEGVGPRTGSCLYYTGFHSGREVLSIFDYLNADGWCLRLLADVPHRR